MVEEHTETVQESLPETPDSSSPATDPSLSRSSSFSRLNAQAPEFVPTRPQPVRVIVPPPPGMVVRHGYPPAVASPFHVPIRGSVPVVPPVHRHSHHVHYRSKQQYSGGGGEQEVDADSGNGLSDEATQKILNQVEYYFSDLNLATTDNLIRHINNDPDGYVPISVVASFKKIKAFITSQSQLASVLRKSSKLVVSEDGNKVKRQHPLTESDMAELQSRIIVAENLPEDHCHRNLMRIFSAVGRCQPQTSNGSGSSASRQAKADGMLFNNKLHAFVEYESVELAEKAAAGLTDERNWRSGLRVRLMLIGRGSKPTQVRGKRGSDGEGQFEEDDTSTSEQQPDEKQAGVLPTNMTPTHMRMPEKSMHMRSLNRERGVDEAGERGVDEGSILTTTVGITTREPHQIILTCMSSLAGPSNNLPGHECLMVQEDLLWVEESLLLDASSSLHSGVKGAVFGC